MTDPQVSPVAMAACAAGLLFDEVLNAVKVSDIECHATIMRALDSGATMTASTSMSRAGLVVIDVAVITAQGQRLPLASHEFPTMPMVPPGATH